MNQRRNYGNRGGSRQEPPKKRDGPVFKIGPIVTGSGESVSSAVWETKMQGEGGKEYSLYRISVESSYFDKDANDWRHGHSFKPAQLGALQYMLTECSRFVFDNSVPQSDEPPQ